MKRCLAALAVIGLATPAAILITALPASATLSSCTVNRTGSYGNYTGSSICVSGSSGQQRVKAICEVDPLHASVLYGAWKNVNQTSTTAVCNFNMTAVDYQLS